MTGPEPSATSLSWHSLPADEVLDRLAATTEGLSTSEAARRFEEHGPNALREVRIVTCNTIPHSSNAIDLADLLTNGVREMQRISTQL